MITKIPKTALIIGANIGFLKTITICLTIAHVCLLPIWELVIGNTPRLFFLDDSISQVAFFPLTVLTLILSLIAFLTFHTEIINFHRLGHSMWVCLFFFASYSIARTFVFSGVARNIPLIASSGKIKIAIVMLIMLFLLVNLLWLGLNRWVAATKLSMLILSPLLLVIWFQVFAYGSMREVKSQRQKQITSDSHNTIWILVFDELDAKIANDINNGKNGLHEFTYWRSFSFVANNAYPPAGATLFSIPAMLQGKLMGVSASTTDYEFSLRTVAKEGKKSNWDWTDTLFRDVTTSGGTIEVVGWCFPYAPLYGKAVNTMHWISDKAGNIGSFEEMNLHSQIATIAAEALIGPISFAWMSDSCRSQSHAAALDRVNRYLDTTFAGSLPDLVWVHFPVPHWPAVTGANGTYSENLRVADGELRRFREGLSKSGRFNEATILVTGDHWFRKLSDGDPFAHGLKHRWDTKDHRVPFILKLSNQTSGFVHNNGFNTIVLRNLIIAIRTGKLNTPQEISSWLDIHTPFVESPSTIAAY